MNNKRRIISEETHDAILRVINTDRTVSTLKHKVVERKLGIKPEMVVYEGQIWYDCTDIFHYAWETGQEALIKKEAKHEKN